MERSLRSCTIMSIHLRGGRRRAQWLISKSQRNEKNFHDYSAQKVFTILKSHFPFRKWRRPSMFSSRGVFFGSLSIFPGGRRQAQTTKGATRRPHEYSGEILHLLKQHKEAQFYSCRLHNCRRISEYTFIFSVCSQTFEPLSVFESWYHVEYYN